MKVQILDAQDSIIGTFPTQQKAIEYCVANKICNEGYVKHSLKTGERFYANTKPLKDYRGYNYKAVRV